MAKRTPKWDKEIRENMYSKLAPAVLDLTGEEGVMTADGLAVNAGKDEDGVDRVLTIKVVVKSQEYSFDDALAENEERITKEEERKLKAEKAAQEKAKKDAKKNEG